MTNDATRQQAKNIKKTICVYSSLKDCCPVPWIFFQNNPSQKCRLLPKFSWVMITAARFDWNFPTNVCGYVFSDVDVHVQERALSIQNTGCSIIQAPPTGHLYLVAQSIILFHFSGKFLFFHRLIGILYSLHLTEYAQVRVRMCRIC